MECVINIDNSFLNADCLSNLKAPSTGVYYTMNVLFEFGSLQFNFCLLALGPGAYLLLFGIMAMSTRPGLCSAGNCKECEVSDTAGENGPSKDFCLL